MVVHSYLACLILVKLSVWQYNSVHQIHQTLNLDLPDIFVKGLMCVLLRRTGLSGVVFFCLILFIFSWELKLLIESLL